MHAFHSDRPVDRGAYWQDASEDVIRAAAINAFGEANRKLSNGSELRFGSHGSKSVALRGEKRGSWYDHEQQDGGFLKIPDSAFFNGATPHDGTFSLGAAKAAKPREDGNGDAARAIWAESVPIPGTPAETYLTGRGILRHVPDNRVRFHPSAVDGKPCAVYAVTDKAGDIVAVQRVPLLPDGSDRDRKAGKMSLGPVSGGFFVLADPKPERTIICEGPEDVAATWFAAHEDITAPNIRAVGMCGQRWHKAAETFRGATFFADADSLGRARDAAASCGGWIVDPAPHKDANDLLLVEGPAALWQRIAHPAKAEAAPEPTGPAFIRVSDLALRPVPAREWLVDDLVPGSTVTTISGDGGVGKSLLALQLAICTSLGLPWAGRAIETVPAIFLTAEDDEGEVLRRITDIAALIDTDPREIGGLEVLSLAGHDAIMSAWSRLSNTMAATPLFEQVEQRIRDTGARLAIFDTLADLHSGQENDRAHARQVIGQFRGLAIRNSCAVILLAHPSLTGIATGTGTSGSTAWNNSVRSRLYLERVFVDGQEADPDLRVLTTKKSNYGPTGAEVLFRWTDGALKLEASDNGLDRAATEARAERVFMALLREREDQGRPVSHISGTTYAPAEFAKDPAAEGVSKAHFRAAMDRLFAAKRIAVEVTGPPSKQRKRIVPTAENEWES
jgi:RecA-family ATPase